MKIYLSKYWIADHISLVCVEVVIVVATAAFCIEYRDTHFRIHTRVTGYRKQVLAAYIKTYFL